MSRTEEAPEQLEASSVSIRINKAKPELNHIEVNGVEVTHLTTQVQMVADAGGNTLVTLTMRAPVLLEVDGVDVTYDQATLDLLISNGWQAPEDR